MDFPQPLPVISNQKMNTYLEPCKGAKINEPINTVKYKGTERIENTYNRFEFIGINTAGRTFISLSLQNGMKLDFFWLLQDTPFTE